MELNEKELGEIAGGKYVTVKHGDNWVVVKEKYVEKEDRTFKTLSEANEYADKKNKGFWKHS